MFPTGRNDAVAAITLPIATNFPASSPGGLMWVQARSDGPEWRVSEDVKGRGMECSFVSRDGIYNLYLQ